MLPSEDSMVNIYIYIFVQSLSPIVYMSKVETLNYSVQCSDSLFPCYGFIMIPCIAYGHLECISNPSLYVARYLPNLRLWLQILKCITNSYDILSFTSQFWKAQ